MRSVNQFIQKFTTFIVLCSLTLSAFQVPSTAVSAQGQDDGIVRKFNSDTGKVTLLTGANDQPVAMLSAMSEGMTDKQRADVLVQSFAPEFGVTNPKADLEVMTQSQPAKNRVTTKYQQTYKGVPVMAGELIVNASDQGALYSMNGEVAQALSLDTTPTLTAEEAVASAKQGMAKWYGGKTGDYKQTQAELWVFDEKLLRPSTRPAELVWRVEMIPVDEAQPIRELVLVNAKDGNVPLHFNQIDTSWHAADVNPQEGEATVTPTPTEIPTEEPVVTETPIPAETPVPSATPIPADEIQVTPTPEVLPTEEPGEVNALAATTYYVNSGTGNDSNTCTSADAPCQHIQETINKAAAGDIIKVTSNSATPAIRITIDKSITLSGGWDLTFTSQNFTTDIYEAGISSNAPDVVVENLNIRNSTSVDGGGIYIASGNFTLKNSSVKGNSATYRGSGIYMEDGSLSIVNSAIVYNRNHTSYGGGIFTKSGIVNIQNSTIYYNDAYQGSGIYTGAGIYTITNSIIENCYGGIANSSYNIIRSTAGCAVTTGPGDQFGINPLVKDDLYIIFNVDSSRVNELLAGSPAINAGTSTGCPTVDQRGVARPQGSACDIGAYEYIENKLIINGGNNQSASPNQPFATALSVKVTDTNNNPISGVSITFTAPSSGASGVFNDTGTFTTSAVSDSNGIATASAFTSNEILGTISVIVSAASYNSATFSLVNGVSRYVSKAGNNAGNLCQISTNPCKTIQYAIDKASPGDIVYVAEGTYTDYTWNSSAAAYIDKSLTLSGGWDNTFSTQNNFSIIDGNKSNKGIVINNSTATVVINNFVIQNGYEGSSFYGVPTTLTGQGGGINSTSLSLKINNSTIKDSQAASGGGIYSSGNLELNNVTVGNNISKNQGGGLYQASGKLTIQNSTIANNNVANGNGGGIYDGTTGTITVRNSIISDNSALAGVDCQGTINTSDHNLIGNTSGCTLSSTTGDLLNIDPLLQSVTYGSLLPLIAGSPAIDAGNSCLATDARDLSRPQGTGCDIGAYEYATPGAADTIKIIDSTPQRTASLTSFAIPLRVEVLDSVGSPVSGATVTFTAPGSDASGTFLDSGINTSTVETDNYGIATAATFTANGELGSYTVDATVSGVAIPAVFSLTNIVWYVATTGNDSNNCLSPSTPCLTINGAIGKVVSGDPIHIASGTYAGTGAEVILINKNVTLRGGWNSSFTTKNGATIINGQGARSGIKVNSKVIATLEQLAVQDGNAYYGGGIMNDINSMLTLSNVTISNNTGTYAGGIYNSGTLTLNNSTVSGNTGNGIYSGNPQYILTLNNSTISANTGYGINNDAGKVTLTNTLIAGNSTAGNGSDCSGTIGSAGYNLIGNTTGCTFTSSTGDLTNVNPNLGSLIGIPGYHPLMPGSPAINAGNPATCLLTDQRGASRVGTCDIGAYEYATPNAAASIVILGGTSQHRTPLKPFTIPLKVAVLDNLGGPVSGVTVTFMAPASGASGTFGDSGTITTTSVTNASGIATAAIFTANSELGNYTVGVTVSGIATPAVFSLSNVIWHVATTGSDSNDCLSPGTSCLTINGAINKASNNDMIDVASGTYTGTGYYVVSINKSVTISGGWNSTFTSQNGFSTIDGQASRAGVTISGTITVSMEKFLIENSYADNAGLIVSSGAIANLTINNLIIRNNLGNGIRNLGGNVTINNSAISDNGQRGLTISGTAVINNTTISNNGGGIDLSSGTITINNSTISNNTGLLGGGVFNKAGTVTIKNSILAGNLGLYSSPNCSGAITSNGYNIVGDTSNCTITATTGDQFNVNPQLNNYISDKGYHPLKSSSPAINAGNPASCLSTDQRGLERVGICDIGAYEYMAAGTAVTISTVNGNNQNATPNLPFANPLRVVALDQKGNPVSGISITFTAPSSAASGTFQDTGSNISVVTTDSEGYATSSIFTANNQTGAYNISATATGTNPAIFSLQNKNSTWYVTTSGIDSNTCNTPETPCLTINGAINKAAGGDTVYVAGGVYTVTSGSVVWINKKLAKLSGGWNESFTIRNGSSILDGGNAYQVVVIYSNTSPIIEYFTIQHGTVGLINQGKTTLNHSRIINNNGTTGGGIDNSGYMEINNSTISDNTAFNGGGIYNGSFGSIIINNSTINNNYAQVVNSNGGTGGGIYHAGDYLKLNNSTVSFNSTSFKGGGIFNYSGNVLVSSSTIVYNFGSQGGGIFNYSWSNPDAKVSTQNSIIAGNTASLGPDCIRVTSLGYNLLGDNSSCDFVNGPGDLVGYNGSFNPRLNVLKDNGGDTFTHALSIGSMAINAGNPAPVGSSENTCPLLDQRGISRSLDPRCDIGAYEGSVPWEPFNLFVTYTANNSTSLPGTWLCTSAQTSCTNGKDPHADSVNTLTKSVADFYLTHYGRTSIAAKHTMLISTVHYGNNFDNAGWLGTQIVYGDHSRWPMADDVVAHELTHGVTESESNLFYFYQSGAINESFSDLWGEYYDQTNGTGSDDPSDKWLIGEDIINDGSGAVRNMSNPPQFKNPDKMSSPYYVKTDEDRGGVHSNSGVNNKAVFLMVDGGAFNGQTVTGIGWDKTAAIYYEVNTNLLSSGADYSDLYYTVQQACTNLSIGNYKGITSADCIQVKKALDAVQMNTQLTPSFNVDSAVCPAGQNTNIPTTLFSEDFENGTIDWVADNSSTNDNNWYLEDSYATSPTHSMYGNDNQIYQTSILSFKNTVTIPRETSYLYFKHAFVFDYYNTTYYDGGVLEYSTDNGTTWQDAKPLFSSGKNYAGTIPSNWGNSLAGRSAFSGDSHGYVSSRYNLTSLAGKAVKFRWVFATDSENYLMGWFVDDVKIYTCVGYPSVPAYTAPADKALSTDYTPLLDWADSTPNIHHYQVQVATDSAFTALLYDVNNLTTSQYPVPTGLPSNATYYWRVRAFNILDETKGWTVARTFRTALTPPVLTPVTLPLVNNRPTFDWSDVLDTTNYTLQISTSSSFAKPEIIVTVNGSNYTPTVDLPANKSVLWWRVSSNGTNGPSAWATSSTSFSTTNPPSVPVLTAPVDKALTTEYRPKLDWNNSTVPLLVFFGHYRVQIATDASFSTLVDDEEDISGISNSDYTPPSDLPANATYYWRVSSYNTSGQYSAWSLIRSFRTALPKPTTLILPADNEPSALNRPLFDWDDVTNATGYTIQISTLDTFVKPIVTENTVASTYTPSKDLPAKSLLYWRVIANGTNGPSLPSGIYKFTTANPPPVLSAPVDNLLITNTLPLKLDWANVTVPATITLGGYQLEVATDTAFSSSVQTEDITTKTGTPLTVVSEFTLTTLSPDTKYYWHVRSYDITKHYSSWSLTRSFRMVMPAPTVFTLPADNEPSALNRPLFDWDDVSNATGYTIQISTTDKFAKPIVTENTVASTYTPSKDLPAKSLLYWRVIANGTNGPSLPSAPPYKFTTANPPPVPVLSTPVDNFLVTNTLPLKLAWANVTVPATITLGGYQLEVATDTAFSSIVLPKTVTGGPTISNFTLTIPLSPDTKYYWHVRSYDSTNHYSSWSLVRSFRMVMPAPTVLTLPGNGATLKTIRPTFDWDDVSSATGYTVQISTVNTFASILVTENSIASALTPSKDLPVSKTLFWRVIANGLNGPSLPSAYSSFTTGSLPPSIPVLSAPTDNLLIADTLTPKLDWANSTVAKGVTFGKYQLEVATDAAFSSVILTQDVPGGLTASEFTLTAPLSPNTKYYWRVRSANSLGDFSGWSLVRSFRMAMVAPILVSPTGTLTTADLTPSFDWDDVNGATYYSIQISTTNTFTSTLVNTTAPSSTFTPTVDLPINTALYWRVLAQGANGPGKWSAYNAFIMQ